MHIFSFSNNPFCCLYRVPWGEEKELYVLICSFKKSGIIQRHIKAVPPWGAGKLWRWQRMGLCVWLFTDHLLYLFIFVSFDPCEWPRALKKLANKPIKELQITLYFWKCIDKLWKEDNEETDHRDHPPGRTEWPGQEKEGGLETDHRDHPRQGGQSVQGRKRKEAYFSLYHSHVEYF